MRHKEFYLGMVVVIIALIAISGFTTGLFSPELGSDTYRAYVDFPIPEFYIQHLESLPEVELVSVDPQGYTTIETNIPIQNSQQIAEINSAVFKVLSYIISVEGSNLEGTPFEDENVPFLCPVDEITGVKHGIHLRNGQIQLIANDPGCS